MKGFIEVHRYTDRYYRETDYMLVNVSRINTVYRQKHSTCSYGYEHLTTIFIDNTEYCVEESYNKVLDMIEEAMSDDDKEADTDDTEE